jgi:FKBP-type peptidyl-prolyl cis-trans isomerase
MNKIFITLLGLVFVSSLFAIEGKKDVKKDVKKDAAKPKSDEAIIKSKWPKAIKTSSGLKYVVLKAGKGEKPKAGNLVTAHYVGTLLNGQKFDSSVDRGTPLQFSVGVGQVIKGWDEALLDMKKGEKRTLIIPPNLGYGAAGAPPVIPANATLIFEVELLDFKNI